METVIMQAETRTTIRKGLGALRRNGYLPGIVYGATTAPIPVQLAAHRADQTLSRLQGTVLIDLDLDGKIYKTVVRDIQRDVVWGDLVHVDFMAVAMDQVISMTVPINLVGEAPAVASGEFAVVTGLTEIQVECLPADIVSGIDVSVEGLYELGDVMTVADLVVPQGVTVLTSPDAAITRIAYAGLAEVEEEEEEEALLDIDAEAVEVIEKGRESTEGNEEG